MQWRAVALLAAFFSPPPTSAPSQSHISQFSFPLQPRWPAPVAFNTHTRSAGGNRRGQKETEGGQNARAQSDSSSLAPERGPSRVRHEIVARTRRPPALVPTNGGGEDTDTPDLPPSVLNASPSLRQNVLSKEGGGQVNERRLTLMVDQGEPRAHTHISIRVPRGQRAHDRFPRIHPHLSLSLADEETATYVGVRPGERAAASAASPRCPPPGSLFRAWAPIPRRTMGGGKVKRLSSTKSPSSRASSRPSLTDDERRKVQAGRQDERGNRGDCGRERSHTKGRPSRRLRPRPRGLRRRRAQLSRWKMSKTRRRLLFLSELSAHSRRRVTRAENAGTKHAILRIPRVSIASPAREQSASRASRASARRRASPPGVRWGGARFKCEEKRASRNFQNGSW